MPIFMDRHDIRGTTAESVAEAHRRGLEIQDKYGVKYMTYWYDEARGTGFCLVEAPDAATATHCHREAHGQIPSDIIPVDLAAVEAFLGRIGDPGLAAGDTEPVMDFGLRGVLVTDIVGSTEMTLRLGDMAALELVRVHDDLVRRGLASTRRPRSETHRRRHHGCVRRGGERCSRRRRHSAALLPLQCEACESLQGSYRRSRRRTGRGTQ